MVTKLFCVVLALFFNTEIVSVVEKYHVALPKDNMEPTNSFPWVLKLYCVVQTKDCVIPKRLYVILKSLV